MIISLGGRTDIAQYYSEWLMGRLREGYVLVRNPFRYDHITRYELRPDVVDCLVFCSKGYAPLMPHIAAIMRRFHTYFFYTITPYGRDVEPGVPSIRDSITTLRDMSKIVGRDRLVWRFDPLLTTERYTKAYVVDAFCKMARVIAPYVAKCIFSVVEPYRKLRRNMPELIALSDDDVREMVSAMGGVAAKNSLVLQSCATEMDLREYGVRSPGCVTLDAIAEANGTVFRKLKHAGMRPKCGCISWNDIGAYDTCPNGCRYCYANSDPRRAIENHARHDTASPMLCDAPREGDIITTAKQRSFLDAKSVELKDHRTLF